MSRSLPALLLPIALLLAAPTTLHASEGARSGRIASDLAAMIAADARGDRAEVLRLGTNGEAVWQGALLELQVHLAPGVSPRALRDPAIVALGGRAGVRAIDVMNVWLPLRRIHAFLSRFQRDVAFVQLPWRPHLLEGGAGPNESQGRAQVIADQAALSCVGNDGAGVKVAVIDGGFEKLDKSIETGEAPKVEGNYPLKGGTHGTMCVEVVADMAPGASIRAISANSYAVLQQFQAEMKMGNPHGIDIVSHSVIWLGMSFGRHEGLACQVTDVTRAQGVVWVNASGNSGKGQFHRGAWKDSDGDKKHDFKVVGGKPDPTLRFKQNWGNGQIKLTLDWDDYAERKVDLDLYLFEEDEEGFLKQVASSTKMQGAYTPPVEQIILNKPGAGVFAAAIVAKTKVPEGMGFRLINLGSGASSFSIWHKNGNVYDPGSCKGVLTVGAIHHSRYDKGPQEGYSSYGPTPDGRLKPEVMAPTGVKTSVGNFGGTSCACPHAAGALALYMAATSDSAEVVMQRLIDDAEPMGAADPNHVYGHGRVVVRKAGAGWQCAAPGEGADVAESACTTPCGSTGTTVCGATCGWGACTPPAEACNGADDDCDGETDEGCAADAPPSPDAGTTDAGAMDASKSDAGEQDQADAALEADVAGDAGKPKATPKGKGGGCSAGRSGPDGWPALLILALALLALRRRLVT